MTPYELWQLNTYGNILPDAKPLSDQPEVKTSEIVYQYQLEEK